MAVETPTYRKLSGRSGFLIVNRARLADDHLLASRTVFFMERYQRLFFRDLQTFSLHPSDLRLWTAVITGVITLVTALIAIGLGMIGEEAAYVFAAIFGAAALVAFVLFVRNVVLGPGCICYVRTAVQTVRLPSLNRMRAALRSRAMIVQRVAAAQAELAVEAATPPAGGNMNAPASVAPLRPTFAPPPAAAATVVPRTNAPPVIDRVALLSVGATGVFAIIAALGGLYDFVETATSGVVVSLITALAVLIASIVHLVVARAKHLPRFAGRPAFAVIFATVGGAVMGYIVSVVIAVEQVRKIRVESGPQRISAASITSMPPGTNPLVDWCYYIVIAAFVAIGVWALVVCARLALGRRAKHNRT